MLQTLTDSYNFTNTLQKNGSDVVVKSDLATQGEMEAGVESSVRAVSPLRVAQAIAALAPDNYAKYLVALNFGAEL